jgi:hypothetical protein
MIVTSKYYFYLNLTKLKTNKNIRILLLITFFNNFTIYKTILNYNVTVNERYIMNRISIMKGNE